MANADCGMSWPQASVYIAEWAALAWIVGGPLITFANRKHKDDE